MNVGSAAPLTLGYFEFCISSELDIDQIYIILYIHIKSYKSAINFLENTFCAKIDTADEYWLLFV